MDSIVNKVKENEQMVRVEVEYKKELGGWEVFVKGKGIEEVLGVYYGADQAYGIVDELEERLDDLGLALKE